MSWTIEEILAATGGKVVQQGPRTAYGEVVTDSARAARGSVFVALQGARFDGHDFLRHAARGGAACLIVHRQPRSLKLKRVTVVRVRDTLQALGDLAHYRREKMAPTVLAITGSNGKTTTKEMVAAILERAAVGGRPLRGRVLKTEGNYNNLIGLPLTLLRLRGPEAAAVLELGTSRPGEIRRLTEIAAPDIGLITSVAPAHLEGLRSVAGVAREKGDLFHGLKPGGTAVVKRDDPWVRRAGKRFAGRKISYGKGCRVRCESWRNLGARGIEFTLRIAGRRKQIRLKLAGEHNLANAVGAAAMAHAFGASLDAIRRGLESVNPYAMRMAAERWRGIGIINDAYNANPASMDAALRTLAQVGSGGEKIAVLGDMLELGGETACRHRELGRRAAQYRIDRLYLLGPQAAQVKRGALRAGMDEGRIVIADGHAALARAVRSRVRQGDWLLFKGSRGMAMEKVLAAFKTTGD